MVQNDSGQNHQKFTSSCETPPDKGLRISQNVHANWELSDRTHESVGRPFESIGVGVGVRVRPKCKGSDLGCEEGLSPGSHLCQLPLVYQISPETSILFLISPEKS